MRENQMHVNHNRAGVWALLAIAGLFAPGGPQRSRYPPSPTSEPSPQSRGCDLAPLVLRFQRAFCELLSSHRENDLRGGNRRISRTQRHVAELYRRPIRNDRNSKLVSPRVRPIISVPK